MGRRARLSRSTCSVVAAPVRPHGRRPRRGGSSLVARVAPAALVIVLGLLGRADVALAHEGSPNYRSTVRSIDPPVEGLDVQVLNHDDRLLLVNETGREVEVRGYDGEPYIRIRADGAVEVNKRAPSYYLNLDRFGAVDVPSEAKGSGSARWDLVDRTGRFEWHDHRIHYMSKSLPSQVTDEDERKKVFDWSVPVDVGGRRVRLEGDLYWVPSSTGLPRGALLALAGVVVAGIFLVEVVRRRRRGRARSSRAAPGWE